jgi:pyruvate formate lyase activating enzyme
MFRCQYCHNPDTWTLSNGIPVTLAKAIAEIQRYAPGLKRMGGGFTLSGGEPLMQDRFARACSRPATRWACTPRSRPTASSATGCRRGARGHRPGPARHEGVHARAAQARRRIANEPVIAFAERLARLKRPMWLRYVLVPGLTDVPDEIAKLGEFVAGLGIAERAEVLPFHQLGEYKWKKLGLDYQLEGVETPTQQQVDAAIAIFASKGLKAC